MYGHQTPYPRLTYLMQRTSFIQCSQLPGKHKNATQNSDAASTYDGTDTTGRRRFESRNYPPIDTGSGGENMNY